MLENQAAVMDLLAVGVAAVGVHNAVNGWRKSRAVGRERERKKG